MEPIAYGRGRPGSHSPLGLISVIAELVCVGLVSLILLMNRSEPSDGFWIVYVLLACTCGIGGLAIGAAGRRSGSRLSALGIGLGTAAIVESIGVIWVTIGF
jgi:hypothetical protein